MIYITAVIIPDKLSIEWDEHQHVSSVQSRYLQRNSNGWGGGDGSKIASRKCKAGQRFLRI